VLNFWLLILGNKVIKCEKNVKEDFCCETNEQIVLQNFPTIKLIPPVSTLKSSFVLPLVIGAVVKQYSLPFVMSCGLILNLHSAVLVKFAPDITSIWKLFFVIFQLLCLGLAY